MLVSAFESAIEKHAAWAAASSSSGVVVVDDPSERAFQFTSNVPEPEESRLTVPDPAANDPCQMLVASLVTLMSASIVVSAHGAQIRSA